MSFFILRGTFIFVCVTVSKTWEIRLEREEILEMLSMLVILRRSL